MDFLKWPKPRSWRASNAVTAAGVAPVPKTASLESDGRIVLRDIDPILAIVDAVNAAPTVSGHQHSD